MKAITIQAKTLEHFLTDIATSHGVHILKNTEFQSIQFSKHKDMPHKAIAMDTEKNTSLEIQFDILVGADGAKSAVRNAAQIRFKEIDTFRDVFSGQLVNHKGLKQVAVVVDFKRIKKEDKWICPPEREFDVLSGEKLHPWFAGFYNDQITTVFKRFYFDHCQMQIFLNQDTGNSLLNSNSSESVWNLIWNVSKIYLDVEYENVSNLKRATYESSVNILPIQIFSAEHTAQVIMGDRPAVLLLVGGTYFIYFSIFNIRFMDRRIVYCIFSPWSRSQYWICRT
jgi:2-polyprenyl-6-methoxyphenol hydroxylase-like FAD-dependent oxidoreductase